MDNNAFMNAGRPTGPNAPRFVLPEFSVFGAPQASGAPGGGQHEGVTGSNWHAPVQPVENQPFAQQTGVAAQPTVAAGSPNFVSSVTGNKGFLDISQLDVRTWFPGVMSIFHITRTPGQGTTASGDAASARG